MSWPGWLTCSGRLTNISGHPLAESRVCDKESLPAKDWRSTTEPRHQSDTYWSNVRNKHKKVNRMDIFYKFLKHVGELLAVASSPTQQCISDFMESFLTVVTAYQAGLWQRLLRNDFEQEDHWCRNDDHSVHHRVSLSNDTSRLVQWWKPSNPWHLETAFSQEITHLLSKQSSRNKHPTIL